MSKHATFALAVLLAAAGAPAIARASEPTFRLALLDGGAAAPDLAPRYRLAAPAAGAGLPEGAVQEAAWSLPGPVVLDGARGVAPPRRQVEPPAALALGILPGFGLGHYLAGSPQWAIWTVADGILFLVWPVGYVFASGGAYGLLGLVVLGERLVEGISAFQAAGGEGSLAAGEAPGGDGGRPPVMQAEVARPGAPPGALALALGPGVL